ncbi:hypothetical protein L211DRAFT_817499 [Terfezia boudieri ATCC MYA-4762]|uniref:HMG box domain-containing protein n=1 Tax=Terfezia boudieri ATCC MYA-4762 TaxID=1051890 RepID=A0A3N4M1X4_9PEZI|nr:hypothetical protein L211DRAFT_817499 [Terfezia boudieri ATCC MYA-4762]
MSPSNEQCEDVLAENPGISPIQVSAILRERWRALSEKELERYLAIAAADKKQ